jgi:hypothetical protein
VRHALKEAKISGFSDQPPDMISLEPVKTRGEAIDPAKLFDDPKFAERAGLGSGLFTSRRLVGAAVLELDRGTVAHLLMRFDLTNLRKHTAAVLHGVQWNSAGEPEGGMTVVALAPTPR